MSDVDQLAGKRDYRTPLPMTGKPYVKTYYDWTHYRWRTEVCILLGARETPPGTPYRETLSGRRHDGDGSRLSELPPDETPPPLRKKPGPQPGQARPESLRSRVRAYLRARPATTRELCAALPAAKPKSLTAIIHNDPQIIQLSGRKGSGRAAGDDRARWGLAGVTYE